MQWPHMKRTAGRSNHPVEKARIARSHGGRLSDLFFIGDVGHTNKGRSSGALFDALRGIG